MDFETIATSEHFDPFSLPIDSFEDSKKVTLEESNGAFVLIDSLIRNGTEHIFGYPGGAIMPIYDALYDYRDQLEHILVRHEQGGIHAGQGYARSSGRTGVVFATSGPGATNLVTGLADALIDRGYEFTMNPGEGAFYGPKIEFVLRDTIGRDWQCGTLQVDLNLPGRLGATYIDKDGIKKNPVMLHRALFGSLERFIGILIEHYAGKLPLWLAPKQVAILPISQEFDDYAKKVSAELDKNKIRNIIDLKNEKINYKIREHSLSKIPILMICGSKEQESQSITLRRLGQEKQDTLPLREALNLLVKESSAPKI